MAGPGGAAPHRFASPGDAVSKQRAGLGPPQSSSFEHVRVQTPQRHRAPPLQSASRSQSPSQCVSPLVLPSFEHPAWTEITTPTAMTRNLFII
jgi:hypothetical protein